MLKMYVIVRVDIPKYWYIPQACHAVAQFALEDHLYGKMKETLNWGNGTIVVLGAENIEHLDFIRKNLKKDSSIFEESYKETGLTSLCFISDSCPDVVKSLPLL